MTKEYRMKKYRVFAKVHNEKFVKHCVNNLVKYAQYLDKAHPGWRYFNVYAYTRDGSGEQLTSFTNRNRPHTAFLNQP